MTLNRSRKEQSCRIRGLGLDYLYQILCNCLFDPNYYDGESAEFIDERPYDTSTGLFFPLAGFDKPITWYDCEVFYSNSYQQINFGTLDYDQFTMLGGTRYPLVTTSYRPEQIVLQTPGMRAIISKPVRLVLPRCRVVCRHVLPQAGLREYMLNYSGP